jgi:hypothetical protein
MSSHGHERAFVPAARVVVAPGVWIRNSRRTRRFAAFAVAWSLLFGCIFFVPSSAHWHKTAADYVGLGVFFFGLAALGLTLARRLAIAGLWIGPDGISVRGPLKTKRIPLADADVFVPGVLAGSGNGTPCPMLRLKHGRPVGVWALGREGLVFRYRRYLDDLQPLCEDLNAVLGAMKNGI